MSCVFIFEILIFNSEYEFFFSNVFFSFLEIKFQFSLLFTIKKFSNFIFKKKEILILYINILIYKKMYMHPNKYQFVFIMKDQKKSLIKFL